MINDLNIVIILLIVSILLVISNREYYQGMKRKWFKPNPPKLGRAVYRTDWRF